MNTFDIAMVVGEVALIVIVFCATRLACKKGSSNGDGGSWFGDGRQRHLTTFIFPRREVYLSLEETAMIPVPAAIMDITATAKVTAVVLMVEATVAADIKLNKNEWKQPHDEWHLAIWIRSARRRTF